MNHKLFIGLILYLLLSVHAFADPEDFAATGRNGWHWYKEQREIEKKPAKQETEVEHQKRINAELAKVQDRLNTAQREMVLHPNEETVLHFIQLQQEVIKRSDEVSRVWKKVLLKHPELDYSLIYSGNTTATKIRNDINREKEEEAIKALGKTAGLFFFYRSTCPYCRAFAPTLKLFADTYHIKVIPITTDGISLPEFPESIIDNGQARKFQVRLEPALFAVNPYTQKAFPIAYGLISFDEIRKNILAVSDQIGRAT